MSCGEWIGDRLAMFLILRFGHFILSLNFNYIINKMTCNVLCVFPNTNQIM